MVLKRKAHRKSRNGCIACKQRRIKCSEEKPKCSHCVRHDVACIYKILDAPQRATSTTSHASPCFQAESRASSQHASSPGIAVTALNHGRAAVQSQTSFELHDLALLHHWMLFTSRSIVASPQVDHYWHTVFPEIGFKHNYVMHGILSLAALHIAYLHPMDRRLHMPTAAQHHALALGGFRKDMESIGPHNADALFASASLMFFYAFLTFGKLYNVDNENDSVAIRTSRVLGTTWIPLVRGIKAVLDPTYEYVKNGPLQGTLTLSGWEEMDPDKQGCPDDPYLLRIRTTWQGDNNAQTYDETLHVLRKAVAWLAYFQGLPKEAQAEWGYNRDWSAPFVWLSIAPEKYFVLQRQRQPLALLLFAYFGVLLQRLDGLWWLDSCGKSIVQAVDECLGSYWQSWMDWPLRVVGLRQGENIA
ncbi:hypothetical protein ACN47E_004973 [Coniothyrium glycines]